MTKIVTITSFNEKYYKHIGKYCVASWLEYFPKDYQLVCYVEECNIEHNNRITQIPFTELGESYFDFQKSKYKDRVKVFSKKGYSIIHAMENTDADFIIWIDADVITHSKVTEEFLKSICLPDVLATFMGVHHPRDKNDPDSELMFSCESSVFVLNKNHQSFESFAQRYREYYDKRLTQNLRRFYDGEVLGATIKDFSKAKMNDLNEEKGHKTPMPRTVLAECFMHFKAGLKDASDFEQEIKKQLGKTVYKNVLPLV